jgi:hypothetical protein
MQQHTAACAAKTVCVTGSLRDKDTASCDGWRNVGRGKIFHNGYKPIGRDQKAKLNAADPEKQD